MAQGAPRPTMNIRGVNISPASNMAHLTHQMQQPPRLQPLGGMRPQPIMPVPGGQVPLGQVKRPGCIRQGSRNPCWFPTLPLACKDNPFVALLGEPKSDGCTDTCVVALSTLSIWVLHLHLGQPWEPWLGKDRLCHQSLGISQQANNSVSPLLSGLSIVPLMVESTISMFAPKNRSGKSLQSLRAQ